MKMSEYDPEPESILEESRELFERRHALRRAQMLAADFNEISEQVGRLNRHFYRDLETDKPIERNPAELIALMHSELSEMLEGVRKSTLDSHLTYLKAEEVELADLLIRAFDYAHYRKLDLSRAVIDKLAYNATRKDHTREARQAVHGKKF